MGDADQAAAGAVPAYLLDREQVKRTKVLANMIKQKRKEKAGKWQVPIPKVKAMTEDEMFKVLRTGKRKQKAWKRVIDKATFVGDNFVRKSKVRALHPPFSLTLQEGSRHSPGAQANLLPRYCLS